MEVEDVLKEYAAADAIAEEIISDRHQVQSLSTRVCSVSRWSMYIQAHGGCIAIDTIPILYLMYS